MNLHIMQVFGSKWHVKFSDLIYMIILHINATELNIDEGGQTAVPNSIPHNKTRIMKLYAQEIIAQLFPSFNYFEEQYKQHEAKLCRTIYRLSLSTVIKHSAH